MHEKLQTEINPVRKTILTLGDPNGLGPELVCRVPEDELAPPGAQILLIGPEDSLLHHCRKNNRPVFWEKVDHSRAANEEWEGVKLLEPEVTFTPDFGEPTVNGGLVAGKSLQTACNLLSSGYFSTLVTAPLNKFMLNEAGFYFPGHTEFLASSAGMDSKNVCMHLCGSRLRVSLVTTHPRLRDVPDMITKDRIRTCLRLTSDFLQRLETKEEIAVCGLNPHAGENGQIGREEIDVIEPAIKEARQEGIKAQGPYPADTIFFHASRGEYGAVLAMYHDQGLAPLKLLHFQEAVNITLGLPFLRVSVDHGTGYGLVGRKEADTSSLRQALALATRLCLPT